MELYVHNAIMPRPIGFTPPVAESRKLLHATIPLKAMALAKRTAAGGHEVSLPCNK
jgi:hypothetical protein